MSSELASSSSQPSLAADLAAEILFQIFSPLRPCGSPQSYYPKTQTFFRQRHDFAQLALVCQSWNRVITTLLYEEVHIISPAIKRVQTAFDNNAAMIKSVSISLYRGVSVEDPAIVMACLKKCSNIQNLECFTNGLLFTSRTWIHAAPSLASSAKALTIWGNSQNFDVTLSRVLMALGRNLERLVINMWMSSSPTTSNFHLPSAMPHLSELEFRGQFQLGLAMTKLFSRIISKKGRSDSILRKLSFLDTRLTTEILTILRWDHLGSHLQTLHVEINEYVLRIPPHLIIQIVKLCPVLVDFSYNGPLENDAFNFLPKTLRSLRVRVGGVAAAPNPAASPSNSDICKFLDSQNTLLKFGVFVKFGAVDEEILLEATCEKKGIIFLPSIRLLNVNF